jgi:dolichyl-phosphate-mannose-protein mannosyltransferase
MLPPVDETGAEAYSDDDAPFEPEAGTAERSAHGTSPTPGSGRYRWTKGQVIALITITLIAAVLRLVHVSDPPDYVFDEVYYAKDACVYALDNSKKCGIEEESTYVHPPLGKTIISLGIKAEGFDSFGWRIMSVIFGSLSIALLFLVARKLFHSLLGASVAALLMAFDFLHFVQSRVAMLDVFVMFFSLLAFYFALLDRDRMQRRVESGVAYSDRSALARPWRAAAGIAAGAATACKWSGAFMLIGIIVLTILWEWNARRHADSPSPLIETIVREAPSVFVLLLVLPVIVYIASYIGRPELGHDFLSAPWTPGSWWRNLWERQQYMWTTHKNLAQMHSYESPSWSWLLLKRPVSYFFCSGYQGATACHPGTAGNNYEEIMATGSPFVWWTAIVALLYTAFEWIKRRDMGGPAAAIFAGFAFTYGLWLFPQVSSRPAIFIFYLLPAIPFMCLALAYVAIKLGRSWEARTAVALYLAVAVGMFVFYYPLLAKLSISQPDWNKRIWVFTNCDKPPGETVQVTTTVTKKGHEKVTSSPSTQDYEGAPSGWCWI